MPQTPPTGRHAEQGAPRPRLAEELASSNDDEGRRDAAAYTLGDMLSQLDDGDDDGDTFDPIHWLNTRLAADDVLSAPLRATAVKSATAPLHRLDDALSALLTAASLARSDIDTSIAAEVESSSRAVPLIVPRIAALAQGAERVHTRLQKVLEPHPADPSHQTPNSSLAHLAHLHDLHSQLASYQALLRLASSWSTLSTDIPALLTEAAAPGVSSQDALVSFTSVSIRLVEARESLEVFGTAHEALEKETLLNGLTDTFVTAVVPAMATMIRRLDARDHISTLGSVDSADTTSDVDLIKSYSDLLQRVGRAEKFGEIWSDTRTAPFLEKWHRALATSAAQPEPASRPHLPLSSSLVPLLTDFVDLVNAERLYARLLHPSSALQALQSFVIALVQRMMPALHARIEKMQQIQSEQNISEALRVARAIREKGREVEKIFARLAAAEALQSGSQGDVAGPAADLGRASVDAALSAATDRARRGSSPAAIRARRSSIQPALPTKSDGNSLVDAARSPSAAGVRDFASAYYSVLSPLWASFEIDETVHFSSRFEQEARGLIVSSSVRGEEYLDHASQSISRSLAILIDLSEDALSHCLELSRGIQGGAMVRAVDSVASASLTQTARRIEAACRSTWLLSVNASGSNGKEWVVFGRIAAFLATFSRIFAQSRSLEDHIIRGLRSVAEAFSSQDNHSESSRGTTPADVYTKLISLQAKAETEWTGVAPNALELAVLSARARVLEDAREQQVRKKILRLGLKAESSNGHVEGFAIGTPFRAHTSLSATQVSSSPLSDTLLPLLTGALGQTLAAPLHSLVVLPLVSIMALLHDYASLPHWTSEKLPGQIANEFQLSMPSFSLGPTEAMQAVGEALLGLVRELEVWIDDAGVKWALLLMQRNTAQAANSREGQAGGQDEREYVPSSTEQRRTSMLPPSPSSSPTRSRQQRRKSSFMPVATPDETDEGLAESGSADYLNSGRLNPSNTVGTPESPLNAMAPAVSPLDPVAPGNGSDEALSGTHRSAPRQNAHTTDADMGRNREAEVDLLPLYISMLLTHFISFHLMKRVLPLLPLPPRSADGSSQMSSDSRSGRPQRHMTEKGWKQLCADIDYLDQILGALDQSRGANAHSGGVGEEEVNADIDARLRNWKEVVGRGYREADSEPSLDEFGYHSPFEGNAGPAQADHRVPAERAAAAAPSDGSRSASPAAGSSVRQMFQAQRQRQQNAAAKSQSGTSTPRGGETQSRNIVDLGAMNVGMGW
ncbi:unnamed protein product [Parajaminaea phylloscopi]